MSKIVDYLKQYIGVISIVLAVCLLLTYSLSYFKVNTESKRAAEMYIGELKYAIAIEMNNTNEVVVPANSETFIDLNITNLNDINTYHKLLYENNSNVKIEYFQDIIDSSMKAYDYGVPSSLVSKGKYTLLKLRITNNGSISQTIKFKVSGGYNTNKLDDVIVPSGYTVVDTLGTLDTSTYFCKVDGAITQGTKYEDAKFTYSYGQEGSYNLSSSELNWSNITPVGWGVQLTDKESIDPVASKVCTYINNKPVISMDSMMAGSKAASFVTEMNTKLVTNMDSMFNSSNIETLDLSSLNTSNVTSMHSMFSGCKTESLDLSGFDTSNVTSMYSMFSNSSVTKIIGLDIFNTSKVKTMEQMFAISKVSELDLSSFDTSNVTNMLSMFWFSSASVIDVSSFDTSKVTNMNQMFSYASNLVTIYASDKFVINSNCTTTNMFNNSSNLLGGSGTKYNSSYIDKTYARIDGGTSNPGYFTDVADKNIPEPNSFSTDSWKTIIKAVRNNNTSKYNVGDTKTVSVGSYGTHTLRIANKSTPSECSNANFSQSACGFVLEFADIVTNHEMNTEKTNIGGWLSTTMTTFVNNEIYNALPTDLKAGIKDTFVVSGSGISEGTSITSNDKLYLLAPKEIYGDFNNSFDSANELTRQLDYYDDKGISTSSYGGAVKKYNNSSSYWWLRSAYLITNNNFFIIKSDGNFKYDYANVSDYGVSPTFRIG